MVYYTSVDCNPLNSITSICSGFVDQSIAVTAAGDKDLDTHSASRGPSAPAELFVTLSKQSALSSAIDHGTL